MCVLEEEIVENKGDGIFLFKEAIEIFAVLLKNNLIMDVTNHLFVNVSRF